MKKTVAASLALLFGLPALQAASEPDAPKTSAVPASSRIAALEADVLALRQQLRAAEQAALDAGGSSADDEATRIARTEILLARQRELRSQREARLKADPQPSAARQELRQQLVAASTREKRREILDGYIARRQAEAVEAAASRSASR